MALAKHFSWRCVVLEEQTRSSTAAITTMLRSRQIVCNVEPTPRTAANPGRRLGALGDAHYLITDANIVVIDPNWTGYGRRDLDSAAFQALADRQCKTAEGFREWCTLFGRPDAEAGSPYRGDEGDASVGYWIGAAVSQMNPSATLLFFSTYLGDIGSQLIAQLLGAFNEPSLRVISRGPERAVNSILRHLRAKQEDLVVRNRRIEEWLIGDVILPLSVGLEPLAISVGGFWDGKLYRRSPHKWIFAARFVFPNFLKEAVLDGGDATAFDLAGLIDLLPKRAWAPPERELRALEVIGHVLKSPLSERPSSVIQRHAAAAGFGGSILLDKQSDIEWPPDEWAVRELQSIVRTFALGETYGLHYLFERHKGEFHWAPGGLLPIDLQHFDAVVEHLKVNGRNHCVGAEFTFELGGGIDDGELWLCYADNSVGFRSVEEFGSALHDSLTVSSTFAPDIEDSNATDWVADLQTGLDPRQRYRLYRGLPLILSFGYFYSIRSLEVRFNRDGWVCLAGRSMLGGAWEPRPDHAFGIRWRFALRQEENPEE